MNDISPELFLVLSALVLVVLLLAVVWALEQGRHDEDH